MRPGMSGSRLPAANDRSIELFDPARQPTHPPVHDGYLDLLGEADPTGAHPGQRLMVSRALPLIYERVWRPLGGRLLMGAMGPGMRGEHRIALQMLALSQNDQVLDVACGTGGFTRSFARVAGDGLVVAVDASRTMLARAVKETDADNVAYLLADACDLPFRDGSFDAVCCFAALYLIERPIRAVEEIVRVLAPGGRVALLTSCNRGPVPTALTRPLVKTFSGVRMFGRDELTGVLRARGLVEIRQRVSGFAQFVGARNPA